MFKKGYFRKEHLVDIHFNPLLNQLVRMDF